MTSDDPQAYLDEMVAARGYVLDYHKGLVAADFAVLKATNELIDATYLRERTLEPKVKELLFIVALSISRAGKGHLQSHMRAALRCGATPTEILEAIEITLPEAGVVVFQAAFEAWCEVTGATGLEPNVPVDEGGSGSD